MSRDTLSNDDDLIVDDGELYSKILNDDEEVQLSGDLEAKLKVSHGQDEPSRGIDGPTPAKRETRPSCMYGQTGDQRFVGRGMFEHSGTLNSPAGARGEMAPLPPIQDWLRYRQPSSLNTDDVSIDAGLSVSSLNPNLNQAAFHGQPSSTAMGLQNLKNENIPQQSEACAHPGPPQSFHPAVQESIPKPSPEDYRDYIKKLYLQSQQSHQNEPKMQQSDWQPPSEMMTSSNEETVAPPTPVETETVIYHQELDENGECPLHHLSLVTDTRIMAPVILCLNQCGVFNQCLNLRNKMQQTPLFLAVQAGNFNLVQFLVRNGADPNLQGALRQERDLYIYRSPIHLAAMMGDTGKAFMESLLQSPRFTNLNEVTIGDNLTPLHLALLSHRPGYSCRQMIVSLIKYGADIDLVVQSNGKTPLILAIESRDFNLVTEILDLLTPERCRTVLLKQTRSGDTCLHIAAGLTHIASDQKERLLRLLVTQGANGNIPNNAKEYPRDFARKEWDNMRTIR